MGILCKLSVGRTHGGDEAMDLFGVLDALDGGAIGASASTPELTSTASDSATRPYLQECHRSRLQA
jgi:hypothetical protein